MSCSSPLSKVLVSDHTLITYQAIFEAEEWLCAAVVRLDGFVEKASTITHEAGISARHLGEEKTA